MANYGKMAMFAFIALAFGLAYMPSVSHASSTSVSCPSFIAGSQTSCTATITGDTANTPTGTVSFSTSDSTGSFTENPCTLGSGGSCQVSYSDNAPGTSPTITAAYSGDSSDASSSGSTTVTINQPTSSSSSSTTSTSSTSTSTSTSTINPSSTSSTTTSTTTSSTTSVQAGPLTVSASPSTQFIDAGESATFTATPSGGVTPYTYKWYNTSNGNSLIPGATASTLGILGGKTGTFQYYVSLTDALGSSANSPVTLNVNSSLMITLAPGAQTLYAGQFVEFNNHTSGGTPPYTYVAYSTNAPSFSINGSRITFLDAGTYYISDVVKDSTGATNASANSIITVNANPTSTTTIFYSGASTIPTTASTTIPTSASTTAPPPITTTAPTTVTVAPTKSDILINETYNLVANSPTIVSIVRANTTLYLENASPTSVDLTVTNVTRSIIPFPGYTPILILNISMPASTRLSHNSSLVMNYPCSLAANDLVPYDIGTDSWEKINNFTINPRACNIEFSIPNDPVIGIFLVAPQASVGQKIATAANTLTANSLKAVPPSSVKNFISPLIPLSNAELAALVVVVIILAIFAYMLKEEKD